jgi:hypothetical protein
MLVHGLADSKICNADAQPVPPGPLDSSSDSPDGEVNGIVIFFFTYLFLISLFAF